MTRVECKEIMATLRAAYPSFCKGQQGDDLRRVVDLWAEMLAGHDAGEIRAGARLHIAESRFAPTLAELLTAARSAKSREFDRLAANYALCRPRAVGTGAQQTAAQETEQEVHEV